MIHVKRIRSYSSNFNQLKDTIPSKTTICIWCGDVPGRSSGIILRPVSRGGSVRAGGARTARREEGKDRIAGAIPSTTQGGSREEGGSGETRPDVFAGRSEHRAEPRVSHVISSCGSARLVLDTRRRWLPVGRSPPKQSEAERLSGNTRAPGWKIIARCGSPRER